MRPPGGLAYIRIPDVTTDRQLPSPEAGRPSGLPAPAGRRTQWGSSGATRGGFAGMQWRETDSVG